MSEKETSDGYWVRAHVSSTKQNFTVLMGLFFLTFLTVAAYRVELGDWNLGIAILIASVKATAVCYYFMHLKYEHAFNTIFFIGSILFLILFLAYTANDMGNRMRVDADWGAKVDRQTGEPAAGTGMAFVDGEFSPIPEFALERVKQQAD